MDLVYNCIEIGAIAFGGPMMITGFMLMASGHKSGMKRVLWGIALVTIGLASPVRSSNINQWLPAC